MKCGRHTDTDDLIVSRQAIGSAGSILSIGSAGSILSIGSAGSILSIGSSGSILSIGSVGSVLSVASVLSAASIASVLSFGSVLSLLSAFNAGRVSTAGALAAVVAGKLAAGGRSGRSRLAAGAIVTPRAAATP